MVVTSLEMWISDSNKEPVGNDKKNEELIRKQESSAAAIWRICCAMSSSEEPSYSVELDSPGSHSTVSSTHGTPRRDDVLGLNNEDHVPDSSALVSLGVVQDSDPEEEPMEDSDPEEDLVEYMDDEEDPTEDSDTEVETTGYAATPLDSPVAPNSSSSSKEEEEETKTIIVPISPLLPRLPTTLPFYYTRLRVAQRSIPPPPSFQQFIPFCPTGRHTTRMSVIPVPPPDPVERMERALTTIPSHRIVNEESSAVATARPHVVSALSGIEPSTTREVDDQLEAPIKDPIADLAGRFRQECEDTEIHFWDAQTREEILREKLAALEREARQNQGNSS
ncbi:hypothetical protein Tco_0006808 [Tanacetum coccineum]